MFNPNFITRIVTSLAILPISLGAAPKSAEAATSYCYETYKGATVCILSVRRHNSLPKRLVRYNVNGGAVHTTEVTCHAAHARNYVENLSGIACFQFTF